jgi:hypothetical protein
MEAALLAVGAIVLFVAIMAVGYLAISRMSEGSEKRHRAKDDEGH